MLALLSPCSTCRNFSACESGVGLCRVWGAILTPLWSVTRRCPHWTQAH
jgi:hypothetical protein